MDCARTVSENRTQGIDWEGEFTRRARLCGFLPEKNHLTAKYIPNRRPLISKSELDFKLIAKDGTVGFFDCKSFDGDRFTYSDLSEHQRKRARWYNEWCVPSGFVIWLRKPNVVAFYSGHAIALKGPRTSFTALDGLRLGPIQSFDLRPIMRRTKTPFTLSL